MLLVLGFGEAGTQIIAKNMAKGNHSSFPLILLGGDIDPMIPGKKMCAIFGFCDIRQFSIITEVLKEEVMIFVNEVAEIVHSVVDKF